LGDKDVVRYRLRFLLQELDLPRGVTVIGRGVECNLTIEDPLVSRQHARIVIDDESARVEDLNSRNGVRVNGLIVRGPTLLVDRDRLRVGTQDLVFCRIDQSGQVAARATGVLRLCANCRLPYPSEVVACPHCEATEQTDESTLTGEEQDSPSWSAQLLVDALERALALGRPADAERIGVRATARLDELLLTGRRIDPQVLGAVAARVAATTVATGDPRWAVWVLGLYRRVALVPPLDVTRSLSRAAVDHPSALRRALVPLLEQLRATKTASAEDGDGIAALTRLEVDCGFGADDSRASRSRSHSTD
jgi:FHA domain